MRKQRMRPRPTHTEEPLLKTLLLSINAFCASIVWAQAPSPPSPQTKLSVHWEELSAAEFRDAIGRARGTCLLPFGILEKHGPHLPLGNDLLNVRYVALNAAQQEYAIVFPEYSSSPARSPTARTCSSNCCRRRPTRWRGTAARRSSS